MTLELPLLQPHQVKAPAPITEHEAYKVADKLIDRMGVTWEGRERAELVNVLAARLYWDWPNTTLRRVKAQVGL